MTTIYLQKFFTPAGVIRRGAVKLGLRTEASARYEKSLDPNMTDFALKRLVYLLRKENPKMEIASNLTDIYPNKLEEGEILLDKKALAVYLGRELEDEEVTNILESLGFKVTKMKDAYKVVVPTFRATKDIKIKEDLIEEIARIYGLEKLDAKPLKLDLISKEHENVFTQEYELKQMLATKFDINEVNSYIWYDSALLKELNVVKENVKILGKDVNNILRDDMSFSLLNIVQENLKNLNSLQIMEIGSIIKNNENKRVLSIILVDDEKVLENTYNKAKYIVKYLFKVMKNKEVVFTDNVLEKVYYDEKLGKIIKVDDKKLGEINVLNKSIISKITKKKMLVAIDIDMDAYILLEKDAKLASLVSKYPTVSLDYTILLENKKYDYLENIIKEFKSKLIKNFELLEIYQNKYTIRFILGSDTKTLEQQDLQTFKDRFQAHIESFGLKI